MFVPPSNICSGVSGSAAAELGAASAAGGVALVVAAGAALVVAEAGAAFVAPAAGAFVPATGGALVATTFEAAGTAAGALDSAAETLETAKQRPSKEAQCHPIRLCWCTFLAFMGGRVLG